VTDDSDAIEPPAEALAEGIGSGALEAADAAGHALGLVPMTYPHDGRLSRWLRKIDSVLGTAEQVALFAMLMAVVITASIQAMSSKIAGKSLLWSFYVIRAGTFSTAMIGAAFASHQQRHLAMDLVSRRLPPRGRLFLRVFLGLFTIFVAFLLARAGLAVFDQVSEEGKGELIPPGVVALMIPLGAGLVVVHTLLFMLIDIDYIVRRQLPPERARSGH
jgi:TRAP-type C4-dicarboxylate transport system permease small subunit